MSVLPLIGRVNSRHSDRIPHKGWLRSLHSLAVDVQQMMRWFPMKE
ncbi:hypothetical protein [Fischerella sp. PCC 9605]|nr:hypothetical protein [Fischerella sp. PCC 9605]